MSLSKKQYNWSSTRGSKWNLYLSGMEAMLQPLDLPLIRALQLDAPYRIADIGCGGGGTTLEILKYAPQGSQIHGFDLSKDLVDTARKRTPNGSIQFTHMNVEKELPSQSYDRLIGRFSTMFFVAPKQAFSHLRQWLVPGGRFVFAVWGPPDDNPWASLVRQTVAEYIERPPLQPNAPHPFRYADHTVLYNLLHEAGYTNIQCIEWRDKLAIGGGLAAQDAAHFALSSFSSFAEELHRVDSAMKQALEHLTQRFLPYEKDGSVHLDAHVHIFSGTH